MIARALDDALAPITDGCVLAVPREASGVAMAATRVSAMVPHRIVNVFTGCPPSRA